MEFLDLYLLAFFGGAIFLVNGFRKRQRKDVFLHGSISEMLMGLISLLPVLFSAERLLEFELQNSEIAFLIGVGAVMIAALIYKFRYEMTHRKMSIHNLPADEVETILKAQLGKYKVDYAYEAMAGKRIFDFPEEKGKITVESHFISADHQVVTFSKTNHIPSFDDIFEDLKAESDKRERPISKTLGLLEFVFGGGLMILGIYALQLIG